MSGYMYNRDSLVWLKSLERKSVDLCIGDPPYNIKKASWDNIKDYALFTTLWLNEVYGALKHTGTLYLFGYPEILADILPATDIFYSRRWLVWHYKNKANLRNDWGRSHETILCLRKSKSYTFNVDSVRIPYSKHTRKYPNRVQADSTQYDKSHKDTWTPHELGAKPRDVIEVPTIANGASEKTNHPTQKPEELIRKLVLASSNEGDTVLDPFSGSGTTATVCEQLNRKWIVCDICTDYVITALNRVMSVTAKNAEYWRAVDFENSTRRKSIR